MSLLFDASHTAMAIVLNICLTTIDVGSKILLWTQVCQSEKKMVSGQKWDNKIILLSIRPVLFHHLSFPYFESENSTSSTD